MKRQEKQGENSVYEPCEVNVTPPSAANPHFAWISSDLSAHLQKI